VPFIKVSSPFNFTVENQTLPVGDYTISGSAVHAQSVIWLQSSNGKHIAVVSTHPRYALDPSARTQLTFQHSGGEYFLSQLWTRGGSSGHDVKLSNRAKGLARNGSSGDVATIVADASFSHWQPEPIPTRARWPRAFFLLVAVDLVTHPLLHRYHRCTYKSPNATRLGRAL